MGAVPALAECMHAAFHWIVAEEVDMDALTVVRSFTLSDGMKAAFSMPCTGKEHLHASSR